MEHKNNIECWYCGEEFNSNSHYVCPICKTSMYANPLLDEESDQWDDMDDMDDDTDNFIDSPDSANELPF